MPDTFVNNRHMGKRVALDDSIELHYTVAGHGEPVILLHGALQSLYTWRYNIMPLAESGFSVFALDWCGAGYSDYPEILYSTGDYTEILLAFCEALGIRRAHLCGIGRGAVAALDFARKHPGRVEKMCLTSPGDVSRGYPLRFRMMRRKLIGDWSAAYISEKHIEQYLLAACFDETRVTPAMVEQVWLPQLMPGAREALVSGIRNYSPAEVQNALHEVTHRTLVVWGEHDPFNPVEIARHYEHEMPRAEIFMVNNCGHLVHEERPREYNARVTAFLKE